MKAKTGDAPTFAAFGLDHLEVFFYAQFLQCIDPKSQPNRCSRQIEPRQTGSVAAMHCYNRGVVENW